MTVADAAGYQAGDVLILNTTSMWPWSDVADCYRGELVTIGSKAGNVLTLREPLNDSYTVAMTPYVRKSLETRGFLLEGVTLRNAAPATHTNGFLRLRGFKSPRVRHVVTEGADYMNVLLECCNGGDVLDVEFLDGTTSDRGPLPVRDRGVRRDASRPRQRLLHARRPAPVHDGRRVRDRRHPLACHRRALPGDGCDGHVFDTHPQGD